MVLEPAGPAATDADVEAAVRDLLAGALIGLPTETVYGLAGDAANERAVSAIYAAKGRPRDHPLIVHVAGADGAERWAVLDDDARRLMAAFWPGPLTLILLRREGAPVFASAGQPTVGLRCPSHPVAQRVLRAFERAGGLGVAAPSANRFGRISPTTAIDVRDELGVSVGLVLEGGSAEIGLESTIVDLTGAEPAVRRPGAVSPEAIAAVLGRSVRRAWLAADDAGQRPVSGTLAAHYAPTTPMRMLDAADLDAALAAAEPGSLAVWSSARPARAVRHWLPWPADAAEAGRRLYSGLRELDASGADGILVESPPLDAAWEAVRDRLDRACTGSGPR